MSALFRYLPQTEEQYIHYEEAMERRMERRDDRRRNEQRDDEWLCDRRAALFAKKFELSGLSLDELQVEPYADPMERSEAQIAREAAGEILTQKQRTLGLVSDAIKRMDAGRYGDCVDCGEPIAPRRLEAIAWAPRCRGCQEKAEGE